MGEAHRTHWGTPSHVPVTRRGHGTGQHPLEWRQLRAWGERFTARGLFSHVYSTPGGAHYVHYGPDSR